MLSLQINQNLSTPKGKLLKGATVDVTTDESGIPLDHFWRSRLKDSKIDNCVQVISKKNSNSKKQLKTTNNK